MKNNGIDLEALDNEYNRAGEQIQKGYYSIPGHTNIAAGVPNNVTKTMYTPKGLAESFTNYDSQKNSRPVYYGRDPNGNPLRGYDLTQFAPGKVQAVTMFPDAFIPSKGFGFAKEAFDNEMDARVKGNRKPYDAPQLGVVMHGNGNDRKAVEITDPKTGQQYVMPQVTYGNAYVSPNQ